MVWQDFNMKLFMLSKSHLYFHALNCKLSFSFLVGFVFSRLFTYLEPAAGIWLIYHLSNLHPPKNTQTNLNFFIFFLYEKVSLLQDYIQIWGNSIRQNVVFFYGGAFCFIVHIKANEVTPVDKPKYKMESWNLNVE